MLNYARAKFRPRPPLHSKVRSSPMLARLEEARCEHQLLVFIDYVRAGKFITSFLNCFR